MINTAQDWLSILVCPICLEELRVSDDERRFSCPVCGLQFPFDKNIPVFVETKRVLSGLKESLELEAQRTEHYDDQARIKTSESVRSRASSLLEKHGIFTGPGQNILEIGSGPFESLHDVPGNVKVSVDPLAASYRDSFSFQRLNSNIIQGFAEVLPFRDRFFDVILTRNSFDHLNNPEMAVLEFNRVLKHDGTCIIECYLDSDPFIAHEPFVLTERFIHNYVSKYFFIISMKRVPKPPGFSWDWLELVLKPKKAALDHRPFSPGIMKDIGDSYLELFAKGCDALREGRAGNAVTLIEKSVEKNPGYFWNSLLLVDAYVKAGRFDSAARTLSAIRDNNADGSYPYVQSPHIHVARLMETMQSIPAYGGATSPVALKVLLIVCLYESNFGDILIYQTIRNCLENAGFKIDTYEISQPLAGSDFFDKANGSDFVYFVGGGIIERCAPDLIRNFDFVSRHLRVPYGVVGLSTGAFSYDAFSASLRLFCDNAAFFYTRDSESIETFRRCGAGRLPVSGVDMVFASMAPPAPAAAKGPITASFRNVPYPDVTGELDWDAWSNSLKHIGVEYLIQDCCEAQKRLGIRISTNNIVQDIAGSSLVVAMRYHIILVAAMLGIPTIPVAYCPKVKRLAKQLGLSDYCLEMNESHRLGDVAARLTYERCELLPVLSANVSSLRERAVQIVEQSIRVIKEIANG